MAGKRRINDNGTQFQEEGGTSLG